MVKWYRACRSILRAIFTDTVTIFTSTDDETWSKKVVKGVQWSDKVEKVNSEGKISLAKYASVTFPEGTYNDVTLKADERTSIFLGEISGNPTATKGNRLSDFLETYPKSGRIKSVNDNTNRTLLKNIKVVVA